MDTVRCYFSMKLSFLKYSGFQILCSREAIRKRSYKVTSWHFHNAECIHIVITLLLKSAVFLLVSLPRRRLLQLLQLLPAHERSLKNKQKKAML